MPSRVGTVSVVPRAASAKVIGTVSVRSSPLRPNSVVLGDVDDDEQVAGRAAAPSRGALAGQPDALAVLDAGRDPDGDRAGLGGDAVAARRSGTGRRRPEPVPRQLRHGSEKANAPWLRLVTPAPWQTGQVCGLVPGLAPLPWQVGQVPGLCMRSGTVTPSTASSKESVASVSTS